MVSIDPDSLPMSNLNAGSVGIGRLSALLALKIEPRGEHPPIETDCAR